MWKDLTEYKRDRLWVILSALSLVIFIGIFWLLPSTVDETITIGVHAPGMEQVIGGIESQEEGLGIVVFPSAEELKAAVSGTLEEKARDRITGADDVGIGILFPDDFAGAASRGERTTVELWTDAAVPEEVETAASAFVREMAYSLSGDELPVVAPAQETVVLGTDRAGAQVTPRERMRPLFAFFVLIMESFALAALIASEIQHRTVTALLVTPARVADVLAAKALTGTLLAFGQALVFLVAVRAFTGDASVLLAAVLLGAVMAAAVGMLTGSSGRDFMGTLFLGMLFLIPLAIPAFSVLFPGAASFWVKVLPSYGIVEAMMSSTVSGLSWAGSWTESAFDLGMALAWDVVLLGAALVVLKRKVEGL